MFGIKDNWKDAGCYTTGCFEPSGAFTPESDHPTMTAAAERARYLNGGPESVNADLLAALTLARDIAALQADPAIHSTVNWADMRDYWSRTIEKAS